LKFAFCKSLSKREPADGFIVPFWDGPVQGANCEALKLCLNDFHGQQGETTLCYNGDERIILLGLGKKEKASVEGLRKAYASAIKVAHKTKCKSLNLLFPECKQADEFFRGIVEGVLLTNYQFSYKLEKSGPLCEKLTFVGVEKTAMIDYYAILSKGVCFVRDLVNQNADQKAKILTDAAKNLHSKIKTTIFDKKKIESEKMGLLLAVGRGSSHDPFLIQSAYKGDPHSKEHIVLVGKGVTYDTGGYSLKPTDGMVGMKCDMGGAALALGVAKTAAELGLKVNVTAVVPVAENCMGPDSYKLGDVYTSYLGKTVEINNTDAEGRLILADALSYAAANLNPSCMIDFATLTGACVVALGEDVAGLFTDDESLSVDLLAASDSTDELLCQLPLHEAYLESHKSDIADLVNSGGREAGAIKAALFLKEFVGEVPWAHIDIAGPAYVSKPKNYNPTKATGYGLRLMIDFLESRSS